MPLKLIQGPPNSGRADRIQAGVPLDVVVGDLGDGAVVAVRHSSSSGTTGRSYEGHREK